MSNARINRKRRRGFIEKRRRDRINNCLNELKRLVPSAYEKQGSQKLEKAEILQMTVDHLRLLQGRMQSSFDFMDPSRLPADAKNMGFRECASEVARFMATEGLDLQDPLRLRLMNHLQTHLTYLGQTLPYPPHSSPSQGFNPMNFSPSTSGSYGSGTSPLPVQNGHDGRIQDYQEYTSSPANQKGPPDSQSLIVGHFDWPASNYVPISNIPMNGVMQAPSYTPSMTSSMTLPSVDTSPMKAPFFGTPNPGTAAGQYPPSPIFVPMTTTDLKMQWKPEYTC